jgi:hypothetical protein
MEMVYPKFQKIFNDLEINLNNQIKLFYVYVIQISKILFFNFTFLSIRKISKILNLVVMIFEKNRTI